MTKNICFQYKKNGYCRNGDFCAYKHVRNGASPILKYNYSRRYDSPKKSSKTEHRSGPAPSGVCYKLWNNGFCFNEDTCTYKHEIPPSASVDSTENETKRKGQQKSNDQEKILSSDFRLCKTSHPDDDDNDDNETKDAAKTGVKLAPIFCKPTKVEKKPENNEFSEEYRNLFYRKRDVNLYIKNQLVIWEFAYNVQVIQAIKQYIKGRRWDTSIGRKGCWTCPLESLPDALDLYEFMGREASDELKQRSKEIKSKYGGSSASDVIKLLIQLPLDKWKGNNSTIIDGSDDNECHDGDWLFGKIAITFLYDADVVSAMKMLAPTQRTYEPSSQTWTIDLLGLPSLLEHLLPLGFHANIGLRNLAKNTKEIDDLLYGSTMCGSGNNEANADNELSTKKASDKIEEEDITNSVKTNKARQNRQML